MILSQVLDFLAERRVADLREIAHAVGSSPDAVRSMLVTLARRGLVHPVPAPGGCGTACRQCLTPEAELYGHGPAPAGNPAPGLCRGTSGG